MKISIIDSTFKGNRLVSVKTGSTLPDVAIHDSDISGNDVILMERDACRSAPAASDDRPQDLVFCVMAAMIGLGIGDTWRSGGTRHAWFTRSLNLVAGACNHLDLLLCG